MVKVHIYQAGHTDDSDIGWKLVATLRVTGDQLHAEGDQKTIAGVLTLTVPDPDRPAGSINRHEDPEKWARTLPAVLRGPAVIATTADAQLPTTS
jgi:hypothetical protein